jgi:hypothetical protein
MQGTTIRQGRVLREQRGALTVFRGQHILAHQTVDEIMKDSFCIALLLLTLVSCNDRGSDPMPNAYERWRSYGLHDYAIDQIRVCYCVDGGQAMIVTVRADSVASVLRLSDGTQLSQTASRFYLTVDSLFGIIRYAHGDSLVIQYNPQYGYPERLDINPQLHPVDGGMLYETSNLRAP